MPRGLKLFAVIVLAALLPLRAVAAVTIGICPAGHEDSGAGVYSTGHGHDVSPHAHPTDDSSGNQDRHSCNVCAEHCSGASVAPTAPVVVSMQFVGADRARSGDHGAPAFITDQLDRPPLA